MRVPFIKPPVPGRLALFRRMRQVYRSGQHTNFGPQEVELRRRLANMAEVPFGHAVTCANATLALEGIHALLCHDGYEKAQLPAFTFPATTLGCRVPIRLVDCELKGAHMGFATAFSEDERSYAITVAPFGTYPPAFLSRPAKVGSWIVDAAAARLSDVREWLSRGADAVVVSLHATKGTSACEGGVVFFKSRSDAARYAEYTNFGFQPQGDGSRRLSGVGSNHKLSEVAAAWCNAYLDSRWLDDQERRHAVATRYAAVFSNWRVPFIWSTQAFWITCAENASVAAARLAALGVEARPYYRPLPITGCPNADALAVHGLCLPTWAMSKRELEFAVSAIEEVFCTY